MPHLLLAAASTSGPGNVIGLLAGTIVGVVLRVLIARLTGPDPRRPAVWVTELVVVFVLAGVLGVLFGSLPDPTWVSPALGAGLTVYAAAGGAFGYLGGRDIDPPNPWRWGLLHFVASLGVGTIGYTTGLLIVQSVSA